ncbi:MAG: hypothetical protein V7K92_09415 [Nostoc sp.]
MRYTLVAARVAYSIDMKTAINQNSTDDSASGLDAIHDDTR